jgi:hypothetical protein
MGKERFFEHMYHATASLGWANTWRFCIMVSLWGISDKLGGIKQELHDIKFDNSLKRLR